MACTPILIVFCHSVRHSGLLIFKVCSDWTKFYEELNFLKQVFLKNGWFLSFIDNRLKTFNNKLVMKRPQITAVEKKLLILSLPYLGDTSLQKRNKLSKSFKSRLNCRKLQVVFKSRKKLTNISRFKGYLPFDLVSGSRI